MISTKLGVKQGQVPQTTTANQYTNNMQQPFPNKYQNVHSSQVGKRSNNTQQAYGEPATLRVGKERSQNDRESSLNDRQPRENSNSGANPQTNNFIPSSNLS